MYTCKKRFTADYQYLYHYRCTQEDQNTLLNSSQNVIDKDGILATRLCTHKEDVDQINIIHLKKLKSRQNILAQEIMILQFTAFNITAISIYAYNHQYMYICLGPSRMFESTDSDPGLKKTIDAQCPVSDKLELKEGAQVNIVALS